MPPDGYIDFSVTFQLQLSWDYLKPIPHRPTDSNSTSQLSGLGHLRITAHIRRQFVWPVRDSWVNWDRLELFGLSCQSLSDLKFSERVERSCTFSCQFYRAVQVVIELHWVEFGSADRRNRGRLIPIPPPWTGSDRQPPSHGYLQPFEPRLNLTAAHWAQLGIIVRNWSWPTLDELFESSWVEVDRSI